MNKLYRGLERHVNIPTHPTEVHTEQLLTNTNDGSKLGLLVLIGGIDGDGAQEDESENGEEDERH